MPNVYAICVGIETYRNAPPIPPAHAEAEKIHLRMLARGAKSKLITGRRATRDRFLQEIGRVASVAAEGDLALIYFTGHGGVKTAGEPEDDGSSPEYLLFHDLPLGDRRLAEALLSLSRQNVVLWLDACHSGGIFNAAVATGASSGPRGFALAVASSAADELSAGKATGSHLTTALLHVLDRSEPPPTHREFFKLVRGAMPDGAAEPVLMGTEGADLEPFVLGGEPPIVRACDVQAHVLLGFPRAEAFQLLFFRIHDAATFKSALLQEPSVRPSSVEERSKAPESPARALAFTFPGLEALGAPDLTRLGEYSHARSKEKAAQYKFPPGTSYFANPSANRPAFTTGMRERSVARLRDPWVGPGSFGQWKIGSTRENPIHGLLLVAAASEPQVEAEVTRLKAALAASVEWVAAERGYRPRDRVDHFGFKDGIATPGVACRLDSRNGTDQRYVPSGATSVFPLDELLVRPLDGDDAPIVPPAWANDGSFLAYRRLNQDVATFRSAVESAAAESGRTSDEVVAAIVGRWPDGQSLADRDEVPTASPERAQDTFDYSSGRCPAFAHARKTNPRDDKRGYSPPIFRRGVMFGPAPAGDDASEQDRGLHFLCYQASIEAQFETIYRWLNSTSHPEPEVGVDALIGRTGAHRYPHERTIPSAAAAPRLRLVEFIYPSGGEYFFAPSLSGLDFLCR
jgi:Dyp-type peroxidase family